MLNMIALPPGCKVAYGVRIDIEGTVSEDIRNWFEHIGGRVIAKSHYNYRGNEVDTYQVAYGNGKLSHTESGAAVTRIHFLGEDASVASMFLLKFSDKIIYHNLKEANETYHY